MNNLCKIPPETETDDFHARHARGLKAEYEFMDYVAFNGGHAQNLGVRDDVAERFRDPRPRFTAYNQNANSPTGIKYSISPDIVFSHPRFQDGQLHLAQAKKKAVRHSGWGDSLFEYIYLDERQYRFLEEASLFGPTIFVAALKETNAERADWKDNCYWGVTFDALKPEQNSLMKQKAAGKDTYLVPFRLFTPLNNIKDPTRDRYDYEHHNDLT